MKSPILIFVFFFNLISAPVFSGIPLNNSTTTTIGFEENKGQIVDESGKPSDVTLFRTSTPGTSIYITTYGISYFFIQQETKNNSEQDQTISWSRVDAILVGAEIKRENIEHISLPLQNHFNYFTSNYPHGIYNVNKYSAIKIKNIYPGIDWILHINNNGLKYDFIINPGADYKNIMIKYDGAIDQLNKTEDNGINIASAYGNFNEGAPYSYIPNSKTKISSAYKVENNKVTFEVSNYNKNETLIIDPYVVWATNVGYDNNSLELFEYTRTDIHDNVFVVGRVNSPNGMPLMNPGGTSYYQGQNARAVSWSLPNDLCIYKFSNNGIMLWGTFYGGTGGETPFGMALDASGNLFITGLTDSPDFPVKSWASAYYKPTLSGPGSESFIVKFDNGGTQVWATYYGGTSGQVYTKGIAIGNSGEIFISGSGNSTTIPFANPNGGAYYQQNPTGQWDAFITQFSNTGIIQWGTYIGGNSSDCAWDVTVDTFGSIYLAGNTESNNFPTQTSAGAYMQTTFGGMTNNNSYGDCFITKFSSARTILWSTYFGGSGDEIPSINSSICTDKSGNLFLVGKTTSANLPLMNPGNGAYYKSTMASIRVTSADLFIAKFDVNGKQEWTTYYGGNDDNTGNDITVDDCGNLTVLLFSNYDYNNINNNSCQLFNPGGAYYFHSYTNPTSGFLLKFNKNLNLSWATAIPGTALGSGGISYDSKSNLWLVNNTTNSSFNSQRVNYPGAYNQTDNNLRQDGIIMKFEPDTLTTQVTSTPDYCNSCKGKASVNITSTANFWPQYNWSNTQTTTNIQGLCSGVYSVTVTDLDCNISITNFSVTPAHTIITNSITTQTNVSCNGGNNGSVNIFTTGGNGNINYTWSNGSTLNAINNLSAGTYSVTATDTNGCSSMLNIIITEPSAITIQDSTVDVFCNNKPEGSVSLIVSGGTAPYFYFWNNSNTGSNNSGLTAGVYTYTVTDSNGCPVSSSATISILNNAIAVANISSNSTEQGQPVQLTGSGGTQYSWAPSTGLNCATCSDPIATVNSTITYTLTVTDENGCTASDEVTLFITDYFTFFTPNTFTPNDDNTNEEFKPLFTNIMEDTYHFYVFDRWGNLIFETNNTLQGWNGKVNNSLAMAQVDTYIWKTTFKDNEDVKHNYMGHINLLR